MYYLIKRTIWSQVFSHVRIFRHIYLDLNFLKWKMKSSRRKQQKEKLYTQSCGIHVGANHIPDAMIWIPQGSWNTQHKWAHCWNPKRLQIKAAEIIMKPPTVIPAFYVSISFLFFCFVFFMVLVFRCAQRIGHKLSARIKSILSTSTH